MATYAVLDGGQVVAWREIPDWNSYPARKKAANDEKGDGGPVLRLRVIEGDGPSEQIIIEPTQVRVVRSTPTPPDPGPPTKDQLKATAAAKRWNVENGGITLNGAVIRTDSNSRTNILGARVQAKENPAYTLNWKASNAWVQLDSATIIAIADAVRAHIQACFDAEKAVSDKIDSNTYTTHAHVNGASEWPG